VSLCVVATGGLVARLWDQRSTGAKAWWTRLVVLASLVAASSCLGQARAQPVHPNASTGAALRVGIVQGAEQSPTNSNGEDALIRYRDQTLRLVDQDPNLGLVVWPEGVLSEPTVSRVKSVIPPPTSHAKIRRGRSRS
jgi:apolipoprotein N-acyltransferase